MFSTVRTNKMTKKEVYFCGSIRGGRQDEELNRGIIQQIDSCGAKVLFVQMSFIFVTRVFIFNGKFFKLVQINRPTA